MRAAPFCALLTLLGCEVLERPETNPAPVSGDCNVVTDVCVLPFPSSRLTAADASSPTGLRVHLSDEADYADHWATLEPRAPDGFSPSTSIVTWLPRGGRAEDLPNGWEGSLSDDASVRLVVADAESPDYGTRVPFDAELVRSAETGAQLLQLTPLMRLEPGSRYAVIITDTLGDLTDATPEPTDAMATLLSRTRPDGDIADAWEYTRDLVYLATREQGVPRESIVQLWDFHTATDAAITGDLDAVAAGTAAWLEQEQPALALGEPETTEALTRFDFTFDVPRWHADRDSPLTRDAAGVPVPDGTTEVRGTLLVPHEATEANPHRLVVFGHALSDSRSGGNRFMTTSAPLEDGYAAATLDWDLHGARGGGLTDIIALAGDLGTPAFAAAMVQSAADTLVYTHLLRNLGALPGLGAVLDGEKPLYLGQSLGALIGSMAGTINDDFEAMVLNVGGGTLSTILRDGEVIDVVGMRGGIESRIADDPPNDLPGDLAYTVAMVISQVGLDPGDPATFAPRLAAPNAPPVLLQWSRGDGIVPNRASEVFARTAELPVVAPAIVPLPGLETVDAPTCGSPARGLAQFEVSDEPFIAHLALSEQVMQDQVFRYFASFINDDPNDDGNIRYGLPGEGPCAR